MADDLLTAYSITPTLCGIVASLTADLVNAELGTSTVYTEAALAEIATARQYLDRIEAVVRATHVARGGSEQPEVAEAA